MSPLMTLPSLDLPFAGTMSPAGYQDNRQRNSLPTAAKQPWPPQHFSPIAYDMRIWSAWHSGSPDELMRALRLLLHRRELTPRPPVLRDNGRSRHACASAWSVPRRLAR